MSSKRPALLPRPPRVAPIEGRLELILCRVHTVHNAMLFLCQFSHSAQLIWRPSAELLEPAVATARQLIGTHHYHFDRWSRLRMEERFATMDRLFGKVLRDRLPSDPVQRTKLAFFRQHYVILRCQPAASLGRGQRYFLFNVHCLLNVLTRRDPYRPRRPLDRAAMRTREQYAIEELEQLCQCTMWLDFYLEKVDFDRFG